MNIIRKADYPKLWDDIVDDFREYSFRQHRRQSNFYTRCIFHIDESISPENPELYGYWESDTFVDDSEYGRDGDEIDVLYRVKQQKKIIEKLEWVRI